MGCRLSIRKTTIAIGGVECFECWSQHLSPGLSTDGVSDTNDHSHSRSKGKKENVAQTSRRVVLVEHYEQEGRNRA